MICRKSDSDSILKVQKSLNEGGVVIIPTDTVYGFSALADKSLGTDKKIFKIKGRDENKPFIQLIADPSEISKYTDDSIPEELISFWPGPLTIIVNDKRENGVTTAFRCPGDSWLRDIIKQCRFPLYSSSVNRSGQAVISKIGDIIKEFGDEADLIVDGGDNASSVPSTIVKIDGEKIILVRAGVVNVDNLISR